MEFYFPGFVFHTFFRNYTQAIDIDNLFLFFGFNFFLSAAKQQFSFKVPLQPFDMKGKPKSCVLINAHFIQFFYTFFTPFFLSFSLFLSWRILGRTLQVKKFVVVAGNAILSSLPLHCTPHFVLETETPPIGFSSGLKAHNYPLL